MNPDSPVVLWSSRFRVDSIFSPKLTRFPPHADRDLLTYFGIVVFSPPKRKEKHSHVPLKRCICEASLKIRTCRLQALNWSGVWVLDSFPTRSKVVKSTHKQPEVQEKKVNMREKSEDMLLVLQLRACFGFCFG